MQKFLNKLEQIDRDMLLAVNGFAGTDFLDEAMIFASAKWVWVPLYSVLLYLLWRQLGTQTLIYVAVSVTALVVITDQGSVNFFKEFVGRYRPCHNAELKSLIQLPAGKCGGQYGFISSHASNVFGLASFVFLLMREQSKLYTLLFAWAGLVSFSRVYLGVHYPSDVLAGAVFGLICGFSIAHILRKTFLQS